MRLMLVSIFLLCSLSTYAEEESWYLNVGFGSSKASNPSSVQSQFDTEIDLGADKLEFSLDFGAFAPIFEGSTMAGMSVTASAYALSGSSELVLYTYLYAASIFHYFGAEVGRGLFLRADFGIARSMIGEDWRDMKGKFGYGYRADLGFAIPFNDETRFQVSYYFCQKIISSNTYLTHGLSVALLF